MSMGPADGLGKTSETEARTRALQSEAVRRFLGEKEPARVIYIPRRLINFVIRS